MNGRKTAALFLGCLCLTLGLAACGETPEAMPDLSALGEITAVAREDGSGTRAEFESLTGSVGSGIDRIALSTEEMLAQVAADENAIGYLALHAAAEDGGVKMLSIDGVFPEESAVESGKYPLCRNYYLAYLGELNEVERDFFSYLLGAGQELVAKSCIPVHQTTSFLSNGLSGSIRICGSSSAAPLVEELVQDYQTYNPNVTIEVEVSDSTSGLTAAIRSECDFALFSRELEDYEAELLEAKAFARDGMAVVVHPANPLTNLTMDQLKEIYDGEVTDWNDWQ